VVSRSSTARKNPSVYPQGSSLLSGEREPVANICCYPEVIPGLDLCVGGPRGREGGVEAKRVEEEGDLRCFGRPVEGGHRPRSHWRSEKNGGAGGLTNLICGCSPQIKPDIEGRMGTARRIEIEGSTTLDLG